MRLLQPHFPSLNASPPPRLRPPLLVEHLSQRLPDLAAARSSNSMHENPHGSKDNMDGPPSPLGAGCDAMCKPCQSHLKARWML